MVHLRAAAIILGLLTLLVGVGAGGASAATATTTLSSTPPFASQPQLHRFSSRLQRPQRRDQHPSAPVATEETPGSNLPRTGTDLPIRLLLAGGLLGCGLILRLRPTR